MGKLTAAEVRAWTEPGRYHDGGGLYLNISDGGTKSWQQRVTLGGTRTMKGLGTVKKVSLTEARKIAERNRATVKAGQNPFDKAQPASIVEGIVESITPTFKTAATVWYENTLAKHPASATTLWHHLVNHVFPKFDRMGVDEISRPDGGGHYQQAAAGIIWHLQPIRCGASCERYSAGP